YSAREDLNVLPLRLRCLSKPQRGRYSAREDLNLDPGWVTQDGLKQRGRYSAREDLNVEQVCSTVPTGTAARAVLRPRGSQRLVQRARRIVRGGSAGGTPPARISTASYPTG